jgi:hypothetical protein
MAVDNIACKRGYTASATITRLRPWQYLLIWRTRYYWFYGAPSKTGFLNREGADNGKQCVFVVKVKASIYLLVE